MDDLTHVLAGTLIARANPSKKRGLVLASCVCGALIPDIDVVLAFFNRHLYITEHRGFTHSWIGLLPMAFLAAWVTWLIVRKKKESASFKTLFGMALVEIVSHELLDWCTSWGTMLLWPNRREFACSTTYSSSTCGTWVFWPYPLSWRFFSEKACDYLSGGNRVVGFVHWFDGL